MLFDTRSGRRRRLKRLCSASKLCGIQDSERHCSRVFVIFFICVFVFIVILILILILLILLFILVFVIINYFSIVFIFFLSFIV